MAGASSAVAFNEGSSTEVLQARTGGGERLATALSSSTGMHGKGVTDPEGRPAGRAVGDLDSLRVDSDHIGWGFTNSTSEKR